MAETAAKTALSERRRSPIDRRQASSGRRNADRISEGEGHNRFDVLAITAALILAPRLQAFEFKDSLPVRRLVDDAIAIAKLLVQKVEVEQAREISGR